MHSTGFTVMFAAAVCVVCSIFVAGSAVSLKDRQQENKLLDRQSKVLSVAGLMEEGETLGRDQIQKIFDENIEPVVVDLETGEVAPDIDPTTFDQQKAAKDPATSEPAPPNAAKVRRLPDHALVYKVKEGEATKTLILPVEGKGLWSTLYGFLAVDASDLNTVKGITFYQHAETPGLGGEVDNPAWKARWPGRKLFDDSGEPVLAVKKGAAGPPEDDPYFVDGLSGATLTSRGVTHLVQFWVGEHGFGPYLKKYGEKHGIN
ncbi:MAG: Na(+)-translocating NADH-quinone reductase subunit C [Myxococcales bacterium]|jgi:Na+-transporting NADH:ubiquinone oxidoreductase subunit C